MTSGGDHKAGTSPKDVVVACASDGLPRERSMRFDDQTSAALTRLVFISRMHLKFVDQDLEVSLALV